MLFSADPLARLRHEVAERQRRRQPVGLAQKMRLDLFQQQLERGVVERQMVGEQQQQPAVVGRIVGDLGAHQWRSAHVEAVMARVEARPQLRGGVPCFRVEDDFLDRQRRLAPHHLHRLRQALPSHRRAQDVVPIDHRLQRAEGALKPLGGVEGQLGG